MVSCICKNMHQNDACFDEIGLHVQNLFIILGFIEGKEGGGEGSYMAFFVIQC